MPGQSMEAMLSIHHSRSLDLAFDLFAYSQAMISETHKDFFGRKVLVTLSEFACHARRVNEILRGKGLDAKVIDGTMEPLKIYKGGELEKIDIEYCYRKSLNMIAYLKNIEAQYFYLHETPNIVKDNYGKIFGFIEIETDIKLRSRVSVFEIAFHYLTKVAPLASLQVNGQAN